MQDLKETTSYRTALKDKILESAMLLFAQQGIRAVKMDDIATSLAISKRTLYELFDDKETLLAVGLQKYQRLHQEQKFEVIRQEC